MGDHYTGGSIRAATTGRAIVMLAFVLGACSESNPEAERSAYEASKPWIALMDDGEYEKCWDEAAPWFDAKENLRNSDAVLISSVMFSFLCFGYHC